MLKLAEGTQIVNNILQNYLNYPKRKQEAIQTSQAEVLI